MDTDLIILICTSLIYLLIPIRFGLKKAKEREEHWKILFFRQSIWAMTFSWIVNERLSFFQGKQGDPLGAIIFFIPTLGFALILSELISKTKNRLSRKN